MWVSVDFVARSVYGVDLPIAIIFFDHFFGWKLPLAMTVIANTRSSAGSVPWRVSSDWISNRVAYLVYVCKNIMQRLNVNFEKALNIFVYLQWISPIAKYHFPPETVSKYPNGNGCHVAWDIDVNSLSSYLACVCTQVGLLTRYEIVVSLMYI